MTVGERRATIKDVASAAGVSHMTVSRVLNGKAEIAEETRRSVLAAIAAVGYRPNHAARSLVRRRTDTIAFLAWDLANPHFVEMARGIQEVAEADGYVTGIYSSHGDPERHAAMLHRFLEGRIDGLVVTFPAGELVRTEIVGLARSGVAVVSVFGDAVGDPPIDNLRTDLAAGTRQAMAHLLGLGHKRVAFVGDPNDRARPGRKLSAYRAALEEAGIAPRADYVRESDWGFASGHRAAHQLLALEPRPTAVVAATDLVALGAIRAADERGLRVPEDVSVVGFTDVPVASLVTPPLTTVAEPHAEAGRAAGRLLLARLKRHEVGPGREILLPCQLVVRATSGPPKQAP